MSMENHTKKLSGAAAIAQFNLHKRDPAGWA